MKPSRVSPPPVELCSSISLDESATCDRPTPPYARRWLQLPERGTPAMLRALTWTALHLGRRAARLLLYPVAFYFLLTARTARHVSRAFLSRIRGTPLGLVDVFRHFHCFAATLLDRVYLLKGQFDYFDVAVHGRELLHEQLATGQGCILLGSHLGSFEVLRTLGVTHHFPLKVLMDVKHNKNISRLLDALNIEIANTVIPPDQPDTLLRVKDSLDAGYLVGALGDRVTNDSKTARCQFLGAPATFPAGPFLIAAVMHCPVILFFGLYRGGNRYEIHFEKLADELLVRRETRARDLARCAQLYATRLEHYTRLAPYNWFNFYPFWDE